MLSAVRQAELLELFVGIRRHVRHGVVAPNKPVTLLWAIDRIERGQPRLTPYAEAEPELVELLREHGTPGTTPSYAFWRLQNDGVWEVAGGEGLPARSGDREPKVTALRVHASGGFTQPIHDALRDDDALRQQVVDLLDSSLRLRPARTRRSVWRRIRDASFRASVLPAYESRCVVCRWGPIHDGSPVAVQAAHVRPHAKGGPDTIDNGIVLCSLHHDAFDAGLIAYGPSRRMLVAPLAAGRAGDLPELGSYAGAPLPNPVGGAPRVLDAHLAWHRRNVYAGERGATRPLSASA